MPDAVDVLPEDWADVNALAPGIQYLSGTSVPGPRSTASSGMISTPKIPSRPGKGDPR